MRRATLGAFAMLAACFTGDSAQGLPCTADEFCAGLTCIDGFCGGAPDSVEPSEGSTSVTDPTGTTSPTSTTAPTSTTDVDTTTEPTSTTAVDTTGEQTPCDPTCWGAECFSLAVEDRFMSSGRPTKMAIAAMDGDTALDVVTANIDEGNYTLELRPGIAGGTFIEGEQTITRPLAANPDYLVVGALDDEPHLDVVVVYQGNDELALFLWTGNTFEPVGGMPLPTLPQPRLPIVMDVDGMGALDVAYAVATGVEVYTVMSIGRATSTLLPHAYYINDLVGVQYQDTPALLAIHMSAPAEATIYRPDLVDPGLDELRFAAIAMPELVAAVDFDLDGEEDVIVVATDGRIWKVPSMLDETAEPVVEIGSFEGMGAPESFAIGQLDGECGLDLAVLLVNPGEQNHDVILLRHEGATLSDGELLGQPGTNAIGIADLDAVDGGVGELVLASDGGYVQIARYSP